MRKKTNAPRRPLASRRAVWSLAVIALACGVASFVAMRRAAAQERSDEQQSNSQQQQVPPADILALARFNKIAFASDRDGNFEIYVMNADGTDQTRLTNDPGEDLFPTWSPDATKLAFVSTRSGSRQIWTMNADGTNQTQLTNIGVENIQPALSPDGTKIAFTANAGGNDEIFVINANGGSSVNLTNNPGDDSSPTWRPDGNRLAFASNRDGRYKIFVMNADGTGQAALTDGAGGAANDTRPFWSPGKITFQSDRNGGVNQIYAMNGDGSGLYRLTNFSSEDTDPTRSVDGRTVFFASSRYILQTTVAIESAGIQIFSAAANGASVTQLTTTAGANNINPAAQPQPLSAVQFSAATYTVSENAGVATITVTRTGSTVGSATINYSATAGTASPRTDFETVFGALTFADGESSKTFNVPIIDNALVQGDRTVTLTLSGAAGTINGSPTTATLTIKDNDTTTSAVNPIDNAAYFVRQQYRDFLNRESDAAGLQFWTNQITSCGADAQCIDIKRQNVSAAFFLSTEFQQTSGFVYRLYKVAFGRQPRFNEFQQDAQTVGQNVIIGQAGATDLLEQNKNNFAADFTLRTAFLSAYENLTPTQFVDALNANAGGALSATDRTTLINGLTAGTLTRANVLRTIADNPQFVAREFNAAFVLAEYFGYLRRNPDDPPDNSLAGYNFWLNKLNQFNGDYIASQMVRSFLVSTEYRSRFGTAQPPVISAASNVLYVESDDPTAGRNSVLGFRRNADGSLTPLPGSPYLTGGTGTANTASKLGPDDIDKESIVSPDRQFLFAVNSGSNTIAAFRINADGSLTSVQGSPFASGGTQPVSLALLGDLLYVANKNQDPGQGFNSSTPPNYTGFRVDFNGALTPIPNSTITVSNGASPAGLLVAPRGGLLFGVDFGVNVFDPNAFNNLASAIHLFQINPNGTLTESSSTPQKPPSNPPIALGLLAHPTDNVLYVGFPAAAQVGVYTYDATGKLTYVKSVGNSGALVCWFAINNAGTFSYSSNNGNNTVSTYDLRGGSTNPVEVQTLTLKGSTSTTSPTTSPVELALSPDGKFLYVLGQSNGNSTSSGGNMIHILTVGADNKLTEASFSPLNLPIPAAAHAHGVVVF